MERKNTIEKTRPKKNIKKEEERKKKHPMYHIFGEKVFQMERDLKDINK